ncbi:MAG: hypothetical protein K6F79_06980 [Saccharofermentans sp.]|nr:hypothetical protein [Saccharofermentans sp.]
MKKFISIVLAVSMGAALMSACGGSTPAESSAAASDTSAVESAAAAQAREAADCEVTDDMQNLFATAMQGFTGANYEPVLFLGTPESNPLGSSFLCSSNIVVPDATPFWAIVTVQDVGDSVTVEDIKVPDFGASSTSETAIWGDNMDEPVLGGWELTEDISVPADVNEAYLEVTEGQLNSEAEAVLATQVVNGMNYCILTCDGGQWKFVFINVSQSGNSLLNIASIDL